MEDTDEARPLPNCVPLSDIGRQAGIFESFNALREVLDACPYFAAVLNQGRQIVYFNRALLLLAGLAAQPRAIGLLFGDAVQCVHATEPGLGCGTTAFCRTCGAFQIITESLSGCPGARECRLSRVIDGRVESVDLSVSASLAHIGGERFVVVSVRDISQEKRLEALERVFFHDILNEAAGVEVLSRMLQRMVEGEASEFAERIRACGESLVREIYSQQQLVAAEKHELALTLGDVHCGELIREIVEGRIVGLLFPGPRIRPASDSRDLLIRSDRSIVRRVLQNMLKNALEASRQDEVVTIGCRDAGADVELWVHNPAVMPESVRLQVFQRSFSTKGSGRGFGTYSMKLLTERYLGGRVTFRSAEGEGTTFIARYPKRID
jgi:signal transduction histidine kinase